MEPDRVNGLTKAYGLAPHPEGGAFSEVYTSPFRAEGRAAAGSIFFLLNGADVSHFHRIDCDELWFYHEGCGMRIMMIDPSGGVHTRLLGPEFESGQSAMAAVPAGYIFAAENLDAGSYTFVSCATAPKFSEAAFRLIRRAEIRALCPDAPARLYDLAYE